MNDRDSIKNGQWLQMMKFNHCRKWHLERRANHQSQDLILPGYLPWSFAVNIVVLLIKQEPLSTKHTSTVYKQGNLQENAQETFGSFVARSAVWLFLLILSLIGKPAPLASAAHSFKKPFRIPSGSICLPFGFHTACQEPHHLHPGLA